MQNSLTTTNFIKTQTSIPGKGTDKAFVTYLIRRPNNDDLITF